jgi:hypothetical protein
VITRPHVLGVARAQLKLTPSRDVGASCPAPVSFRSNGVRPRASALKPGLAPSVSMPALSGTASLECQRRGENRTYDLLRTHAQKVRGSIGHKMPANTASLGVRARGAATAGTHWVPVDANAPAGCAHQKGLRMQAFSRAAEGIRTLDLLHGKQSLRQRRVTGSPCKWTVFLAERRRRSPSFTARSRGFAD